MTRDVFLLPSLRVLAAYANFLLALVIEAVFEKLTLTTKITKATKGSNIYTLRLRALRVLGGKSVFSSWLRLAHAGAIAGFLLTGCTAGPGLSPAKGSDSE